MGTYGARFYVPPYCDPIRPYADPLVWRELSWYGAHIAYKLEEGGFQGILNAAQYAGWGHFGWHWITPFHNIAGMLTESAGVNLASPVYVHPDQLKANARMFPEYEAQSTFPNPWPGRITSYNVCYTKLLRVIAFKHFVKQFPKPVWCRYFIANPDINFFQKIMGSPDKGCHGNKN